MGVFYSREDPLLWAPVTHGDEVYPRRASRLSNFSVDAFPLLRRRFVTKLLRTSPTSPSAGENRAAEKPRARSTRKRGESRRQAGLSQRRGILDDRELVDYCLTGEPAAWTKLYHACHEPLLEVIRSFLRGAGSDRNLVDEIAARVWFAVVRNDAELLSRFDVARGCRLTTFLAVVAKSKAHEYFRSERRRRAREETASRSESVSDGDQLLITVATKAEFLATLTASERTYYETVLMASGEEGKPGQYSPENGWQLRRRVRKKLGRFLQSDE